MNEESTRTGRLSSLVPDSERHAFVHMVHLKKAPFVPFDGTFMDDCPEAREAIEQASSSGGLVIKAIKSSAGIIEARIRNSHE